MTSKRDNSKPMDIEKLNPAKERNYIKRLSARVDMDLALAVKHEAKLRNINMNFAINQALFEWLKNRMKK